MQTLERQIDLSLLFSAISQKHWKSAEYEIETLQYLLHIGIIFHGNGNVLFKFTADDKC